MKRFARLTLALALLLVASGWLAPGGRAQDHALTARAFARAPSALGMGDAGVALPSQATAYFYNPAHLAHASGARIRFVGTRGALSENLFKQIRFLRSDLLPAVSEGLDKLEQYRLDQLYGDTQRLGRDRTFVRGDLLLPTVALKAGPVGFGGGVFAHSQVRYRFENGGAGVPTLDFAGQSDLMGVVSTAVDLGAMGGPPLTVGLSGKYTRRYLSLKRRSLDALEENEDFYAFTADATGADLGLLYEAGFLNLPGTLRGGLSIFDIASTGFDYAYDRNVTKNGEDNAGVIAQEEVLADTRYALHPSYRAGVAYAAPSLFGLFGQTGLAVDYLGYTEPRQAQAPLARVRIGAQVQMTRHLALRLGLNQGYPTAGFGLETRYFALHYAFYGQEEGRLPGQLPSFRHTVQVALGLF